MRPHLFFSILVFAFAACEKKAPPTPQIFERDQPHAPVTAVQTVPFDEGYKAGFTAGTEDAKPKAPLPTQNAADIKASAAAGAEPDRNEKWQHGYAEGYQDGFRKIARHER